MPTKTKRRVDDVSQELVPNDVLKKAYHKVASEVGHWRENFVGEPMHLELVKQVCGKEYSHIRTPWFGLRISRCCKAPGKYGGGWGQEGASAPQKGHKGKVESGGNPEYLAYLQSEEWAAKRRLIIERAGGRCQVCNDSRSLHGHHRTYDTLGTDHELNDCVCLCKTCHKGFHEKVKPFHWQKDRTLWMESDAG